MKSKSDGFDWRGFLGEHPLFGELGPDDVDKLLDPKNSSRREFSNESIIFRSGEIGNSFFLIGEGSVNVELESDGSSSTIITTLYRGDYFGEMSAIDAQNGRAATIIANEDCKLLEIKSKPFQQVLKANPELEFQLLSMLAARLRHVNDHLLQNTRLTYDTKFSLLSEKIESQSKVVDASLNASQAVFEQTKVRTSEIINAAERGRTRITWVMSTLTAGFTLLLALFSFLGYDKLNTAEDKLAEIEKAGLEVSKIRDEAMVEMETLKASVSDVTGNVDKLNEAIGDLNSAIDESVKARKVLFESLMPIFFEQVNDKLESESEVQPEELGHRILEANINGLTINFFKDVYNEIRISHDEGERHKISFYTSFLYLFLYEEKALKVDNPLARFLANYILMATYALNQDYARDNDFYHGLNPAKFPRDGIQARIEALDRGSLSSSVETMNQLDRNFVSDLKAIEWEERSYSNQLKNQVQAIWSG